MSARHFEGAIHAAFYAKFRPTPPPALISRICIYLKEKYSGSLLAAVDVGCGSGQSTRTLSEYFGSVTGTDISEAQIIEALKSEKHLNISYKVSSAENLPFENESLELVTSGQACHWFDLPKFYDEVQRVLVPNGVLALYGYGFPRPHYGNKTKELCSIMDKISFDTLDQFWDNRIDALQEEYKTLEEGFPYKLHREEVSYERTVTVRDLQGYLRSWSGFQNLKSAKGEEAAQKILDQMEKDFMDIVGDPSKTPESTELLLKYNFFLIMGRKA